MKYLITIASLASAACAIPTIRRSDDARDSSSSLAYRQASAFPSTSGTSFVIDGKQQYFAGTNTYWIGFQTNNADVDLVMKNIASSGMKVLRVWGFNDVTSETDQVYYQSFVNGEAKINTGANGLERLDYVVKSAEANGVKLIINFVINDPMQRFRDFLLPKYQKYASDDVSAADFVQAAGNIGVASCPGGPIIKTVSAVSEAVVKHKYSR